MAVPSVLRCPWWETHSNPLPTHGGSDYYNYKGFHSIILMALVDSDYEFSWVDVGSNGSAGDVQVFNRSELKQYLEEDCLGVPVAGPLPGDAQLMLTSWLMKLFSKRQLTNKERIYNYRLSRVDVHLLGQVYPYYSQRHRHCLVSLPST